MGGGVLYAAVRLIKLWMPVILWAGLILWASDDTFSSGQSHGWLARFFGGEVPYGLNFTLRKLGHIVAYGILGALAWRADRRFTVAIAITLIVAATDEWRQSLSLTRTGSAWDVVLDTAGSWLGMVAAARRTARHDQ